MKHLFRKWSNLFSPAARRKSARTHRRIEQRTPQNGEYLEDRTLLAVSGFTINLGVPADNPDAIDIFSEDAGGQLQGLFTGLNFSTGSSVDNGGGTVGIDVPALPVPDTNNQPPVAVDDFLTTDEDTTLMANVFAPNPATPDTDGNTDTTIAGRDDVTVIAVDGNPANVGVPVMLDSGSLVTVFSNGDLSFTPAPALNSLRATDTIRDTFTYTIGDEFEGTDVALVTIDTLGVNDAPTIDDATFSLDESAIDGTSVGTPASSDVDGTPLSYTITGGNTGNAFTIDPGTGEIIVNDTTSIDFEVATSYALNVEVSDGSLMDAAVVMININDAEPQVTDQTLNVDEGVSNGTSVGTIMLDPPPADQNSTGFIFTSGNEAGAFSLNATTGEVTVADTTALNFELQNSFPLALQISDDGGTTIDTATVTININDIAPMISAQTFSVDEDAANGTSLGTLAVDFPPGITLDDVTFALTAGNTAGAFTLNSTTGELTVSDTTAIDFEVASSFSLAVQVTDNAGATTDSATITVNVSDIEPMVSAQTFNVDEDAANGTDVGTVLLDQPPGNDINSVSFSITGGNTGAAFAINNSTGEITVADGSAIDFDMSHTFLLTVEVTDDAGSTTDSATVTVDINDIEPLISDQTFSVDEAAANGTSVGTVPLDMPPGNNIGPVTFQITAGDSGGAFEINGMSGEITVADTTAIDFEVATAFSLTVEVTDDGGTTIDSATVTVNVNDTEPTVSNQSFTLDEDVADAASVGTVTLDQPPGNDVNSVDFSITAGNAAGAFTINSSTGEITVADTTAIDFEVSTSFALTVQVTDDAGATTDTATVTINVNDVEPMVSDQTFSVAEDVVDASSVGTVALDQPPGNDINSVAFSIAGGNTGSAFAINPVTGEITVADSSAIDFEVSSQFVLTVEVTDDAGVTTDTADVTINVTDVTLSLGAQSFNLAENAPNGTSVGTVLVNGDAAPASFAITAGNDDAVFAINATTGELTLLDTSLTDFEDPLRNLYQLTVMVTGEGGGTSDSATITINITDESPLIVPGQSFSINEDAPNDSAVGVVDFVATQDGNSVSFAITGNNPGGAFAIDAMTGQIMVADTTAIDFEAMASFGLDVTVTDGTNMDTNTVTVDVNNRAETVDLSVSTSSATESGSTVVTVTATADGVAVTGSQTVDLTVLGTGISSGDYVLSSPQITIADGTNSGSVTFTITNDQRLEGDETATLSIGNASSGLVLGSTTSQSVSIEDNEIGQINLAADQSAVESASQAVSATLTIMAGGTGTVGLDMDVSVDVQDLGTGTATSGIDYSTFPTQTLTFFAADGAAIISTATSVAGIDDGVVEDDETVDLQLGNIADDLNGQVVLVDADHTATLTNDDFATLTIGDQTITESDADQSMTFTVTLDRDVQGGFMLDVVSALGTAEGTDFTVVTPTPLTFAGTASETQTVTVTAVGDDQVEADETFTLTLGTISATSTAQIAGITSGASATGTIINDDTASVTIDDVTVTEGTGSGPTDFVFTVTLDSDVEDGLTVGYSTNDGTATDSGGDYTDNDGTLNFSGMAGETETITVSVTDDTLVEADETFTVLLGALTNIDTTAADDITVQMTGGDGVITNDDTASLTIDDVTMSEVAGGATTDYVFTVTLSNDVQGGLTVAYDTTDGTATAAGGDYIDNDGTLNFAGTSGETQTVTVTVSDDAIVETNETFAVILGALSNIDSTAADEISVQATGGDGVINNDDGANLTIADVTLAEGTAGGPTNFEFTVTLDNPVEGGLTVAYTTNDGTATTADNDYIDNDGSLSFAGTTGETQTITVAVPHDSVVEPDETFSVLLGALSGVNATQSGMITVQSTGGDAVITNDDSIAVSFSTAAASDAENVGGNLPTVQYSGTIQTGHSLNIDVMVTGGSADAPDFTAPNTITVVGDGMAKVNESVGSGMFAITSDTVVEDDETVILGFNGTPMDVTPTGTTTHTYTITNDDTANLTINDVAQNEGAGGASTDFVFTVALDNSVEGGLTLSYVTNDGTATVAGGDYVDNDGQLIFAGTGGETQTVTVSVPDDTVVEPDEAFTVLLGVLSNIDATAADDIVVQSTGGDGTITNDDAIDVQFTVAADNANENSAASLPSVLYSGTIQEGHTVDVDVTVTGGSATVSSDFTSPGTITVTGDGALHTNENLGNGLLAVASDTVVEPDESFSLGFNSTPVNINPSGVTTHTYTILNDDTASVTVGDLVLNEGSTGSTTTATFSVVLDNDVQDGFDLTYATSNGTATSGSDYTAQASTLNFAGTTGETQMVTIDVSSDTVVEADETFNLSLLTLSGIAPTAADDITVQGTAASATITNDDTASISVDSVTMNEGAGGATTEFTFTVTLDNAVEGGFMLPYTTNDGTATTAGTDYTDNDGTLIFGGTAAETRTITVTVQNDSVVEADETFDVLLGSLTAIDSTAADDITVQAAAATGTVTNDDTAMLSINDVSASEGTGGGPTNLTFTITLTNDVQGGLTVNYTSDDMTALAGTDYIDMDDTVAFSGTAGETQTVTVQVLHDSVVEADETFRVRPGSLTNIDPSAADDITLPTAGGIGTITNDDTATITIDSVMSTEGTGGGTTSYTFTATLDNNVQDGFQLVYSTIDGSAEAGTDFVGVSGGTLAFAGTSGESQTLTVIGTHDDIVEPDETFVVNLDSLSMIDATAADDITLQPAGAGTATIQNDDAIDVHFSAGSATDNEDSGGNLPVVQYTGTIQSGHLVSIPVTVTGGSATSGSDFTVPGSITVAGDGLLHTDEAVGSGALAISMDAIVEADETIALGFDASPSDINPTGTTAHTYTITNDDTATITVSDLTVTEGTGAGTTTATFTVTLNAQVEDGFNLAYTADDVTATAGADYVDNDGSLNFTGLMNESQSVSVVINRDATVEADETFSLALGTLTPVDTGIDTADITFTGNPGTATITDDDAALLTISDVTTAEGTGAGTTEATFTVSLNNPVEGGFDVDYTTDDGTALAGSDYTDNDATLSFAGTANESQTVTVVITRDSAVEVDESFTVSLGTITPNGAGVSAGDITTTGSPATGTITDDDTATVSISNVTVAEGTGGGPTQAMFTVTLNNPVPGGFDLAYTTDDGTALSGSDYVDNDSTLSFAGTAGESQMITVNVLHDAVVEADETFTVSLGSLTLNDAMLDPADVTIGGSPATGTISNDDGATLTIGSVTAGEGTGGGTNTYSFPVTLDAAVDGGFSVSYTTSDGTATLVGSDYIDNDSSLTFAGTAGETINISVAVSRDSMVEADETFVVTLGSISGLGAGLSTSDIMVVGNPATGTITNDDTTSLSIGDVSLSEGSALAFPVTLTNAVQGGLSINFTTIDGTATTTDSDYQLNTGTLNFAGSAAETMFVTVVVNADAVIEPDETFTVDLSGLAGLAAGVDSADITVTTPGTGTIENDDMAFIQIIDMAESEGDAGTTAFDFTVRIVDAGLNTITAAEDITFDAATADQTATLGDTDYVQLATTQFTILAGNSTVTISVDVNGDAGVEPDETFLVNLSNPQIGGATDLTRVDFLTGFDQGVGTIENDD